VEGEVSVVVAEVEAGHFASNLLVLSLIFDGREAQRWSRSLDGGDVTGLLERVNAMMRLSGSLAVELD
jgi:hypothetical protein